MLKFYRQVGQNIIVDNDITVSVLEIKNGVVVLGFVRPQQVPVQLEEFLYPPRDQTSR